METKLLDQYGRPYMLAEPKPRNALTVEAGQGGVTYWSGLPKNDEFNEKLTGTDAITNYDKMRRTDSQVQALLFAVTLPILSAHFDIIPPEGGKVTDEQLEFARENLFRRLKWNAFLKHALSCLWAGFSWFEKVYELDNRKMLLKSVAPRLASTLWKWNTTPQQQLESITQRIVSGQPPVETTIPFPSKAIVFSYQQEGNNYEGQSILRAAYKHWFIKDQIYHIDAIRIERFALGVPHFSVPEEGLGKLEMDALILAGKRWKAGDQAFLITPSTVTLDIKALGQGQVLDVLSTIQHHNEEIAKAGLAQFLSFGTTQTGTRALGETTTEFFYDSERALGQWLCETINEQILWPLMDLNFPGAPRPQLVVSDIGAVAFPELILFLQRVGGSFIMPDEDIENHLRKMMSLPLRSKKTPPPGQPAQAEEGGPPQLTDYEWPKDFKLTDEEWPPWVAEAVSNLVKEKHGHE